MARYSQEEIRSKINHTILAVLQEQQSRAADIHPAYRQLWHMIEDLLMAGGKRLRPYLVYLAYTLFENDEDIPDVFIVAAAQEFLHFALLIHDDIIDRDTIRYGQKNIMGNYEAVYVGSGEDAKHFASGAALMAGDLALAQAYDLINTTGFSAEKKYETIRYLSESVFHVAGGELLDMEAAFRQPSADYFTIAQHKTARYSFVGPILIGANLATAPTSALSTLKEFGLNLGIAYQLADDLLGLYGDEKAIGKPVISDLREGKKTYLFEVIQQLSNGDDQEYFSQVWGSHQVTMSDVEQVRRIGTETGAKARVEELMYQYAQQSLALLDQLSVSSERMEPLRQLANRAVNRNF